MTILDKGVELLKVCFPKPIIPQKRYVLLVGLVVYGVLRVYTAATPTTSDDAWPDRFKDIFMQVVSLDGQDSADSGQSG